MKNKEKQPTKKKTLIYYLILAASLIVIAAITVGVVFAVRNNRAHDITIEAPKDDGSNSGDKTPGEGDNSGDKTPDDPVEDTSSKYDFILPIKDANLSKAHVFSYNKTMDYYRTHHGMDFAAAEGTEVVAPVDGVIKEIITNSDMYGGVIKISHANDIETVYHFVVPVSNLKVGSTVKRGETIATVAKATGVEIEDGDHLHLEAYQSGKRVDPDIFLKIVAK